MQVITLLQEAIIEKADLIKKSILAKAFCGELENDDPEKESAVYLLKEVLKEKTCNQ